MSRTDKLDYEREFANFELANSVLEPCGKELTQSEFAYYLGVSYQTLSIHFKELREKAENQEIINNLKAISRKGLNKVSVALDTISVTTIKESETMSRIAYGAADRIGFSPQAATINIQNSNTQQTLVIPPMFAGEETQEIKNLIGDF